MAKPFYVYMHVNGSLLHKSAFVVGSDPEYFDSPFVKKVWKIDPEDETNVEDFAREAVELGANPDDSVILFVRG